MICSLRGTLLHKTTDTVMIETGGIGYEVAVPLTVFTELPAEGRSVFLFVQTVTKEDGTSLYGFATLQERDAFNILRLAKGIGAKTAISLLSTFNADELALCIVHEDIAALTRVPGIGRKTAERIVFELKDRFAATGTAAAASPELRVAADAELALVALGYTAREARAALAGIAAGTSIEQTIREALKHLVKVR